jgi:two-component system response regulator LytT
VNILLVEDELTTARAVQRLLKEVRPAAQVLDHLETVVDTVAWLQENPAPDLILMDIHLADGSSFEVFRRVAVTCPVIFVTAYNEHALDAFQVNGIDYLLKPLTRADLQRSLDKFDALRQHYAGTAVPNSGPAPVPDFTELLRTMQQLGSTPAYKTTWLVPHKTKLMPIAADEVAHFVIRHGLVSLTTLSGQEYSMDVTLEVLESQVDPRRFFRANRQVLFARTSVVSLEPYYNGRMLVHLRPAPREEVIVPKPRVTELRRWIS